MKKFEYKFKKGLSYLSYGVSIAIGIFAIYKFFFGEKETGLGMFLISSAFVVFLFLEWAGDIDPDLKKEREDNLEQNEKIHRERIKISNKKLRKSFFRYTAISFPLLALVVYMSGFQLIISFFAGLIFALFLSTLIVSFQKYIRDRQ